jgi:DNA-binding beta-propeller fold protein YncE
MHVRLFPAAALLYLSCSAPAQTLRPLPRPHSYTIALPGSPYGVVTSPDGDWVFVGLTGGVSGGAIAVLQLSETGYALVRVIQLPNGLAGIAITHDGKLLIAPGGSEVYFLDVSSVGSGGVGAVSVIGSMSDGANAGSVWASTTADDHWLFICDENTGQLTVTDLNMARSNGFVPSSIVGRVSLGGAPTSVVFSNDGSVGYVTIETAPSQLGWTITCTQEGTTSPALINPQGAIVMFSVAIATSKPSTAVASTGQFIPAGCSTVRVILSPDGNTLYATARNSNEVLALDPSKFTSDPAHAIIATAPVGIAPVPVAIIDSGTLVVVGNSNRFFEPNAPQTLDVLDTGLLKSGAGGSAIVHLVPTGAFPRALTPSPDGRTLFLSNYDSNSLQVFDALTLGEQTSRRQ